MKSIFKLYIFKLAILSLAMIFLSFGASASQICKIKPSDIKAFASAKQQFDPYQSFEGKVWKSFEESAAWQKKVRKFHDEAKEKEITFYFDEVINKKCEVGDVLVVTHFIAYKDLLKYQTNPYWLNEYFNDMITRVCKRESNIRQITRETYVFENKKGIQHFLECIYDSPKKNRKDLKFYKNKQN